MKNIYKQKRNWAFVRKNSVKSFGGFTIIEVMIVLAIAAVILLIVLLAVPALQRSSRNTQRDNDAGSVASAVNGCLANQNGNPANCVSIGPANVDQDLSKLGQLTAVNFTKIGSAPSKPSGSLSSIVVTYGYKCTAPQGTSGTAIWGTGTSRQFMLTYLSEASSANVQKCIDG